MNSQIANQVAQQMNNPHNEQSSKSKKIKTSNAIKTCAKRTFTTLCSLLLAISILFMIAGCTDPNSYIKEITATAKESDAVTYTVYSVYLTEDVDWASLDTKKREEIARVGFDEAQKKIQEYDVFNYEINGYGGTMDEMGNYPNVFRYDAANKEMLLLDNNVMTSSFSLPTD